MAPSGTTAVTASPNTPVSPLERIGRFDTVYCGTPIRFVEKFTPSTSEAKRKDTRPALFLDRDGVLNSSVGFINATADVEKQILPKQIAAILEANKAGLRVVLVTNQGGIEINKMTPEVAVDIHKAFIDAVEK